MMENLQKKIGLVIVTYNQYELTRSFLLNFEAKFKNKLKPYLLILDNNSTDETYEKLKTEFNDLDIRRLNENYGCVTGRNIGILELINLGFEYICILDNDIFIEDDLFFEKILLFMNNNKDIDGCCPVVLYGDDKTEQTRGAILEKIRIKNLTSYNIRKESLKNNFIEVDILPGCSQFLRASSFIKFGLFDNDLSPISIEDCEWGIRARKNGAKFASLNNINVLHYTKKNSPFSKEKSFNVIVGRIVFLRKYPTIYNILRELKYFIYNIFHYGLNHSIKAVIEGFRRKINNNNYHFDKFSSIPLDKYYKNNNNLCILGISCKSLKE